MKILKKALWLWQNRHKTPRACIETKWQFYMFLSKNITNGIEFTSQNWGKPISEQLNFKMFWETMSPDPLSRDTEQANRTIKYPPVFCTLPTLKKITQIPEYYRNFRTFTCTADYPQRSIFVLRGKKVQQITRTGLLPAPQNKRKSCYSITGIRTHKLGAMNILCCCLQSERSITFSAKNWL